MQKKQMISNNKEHKYTCEDSFFCPQVYSIFVSLNELRTVNNTSALVCFNFNHKVNRTISYQTCELTTVSSRPFRSCLACSLLSCITLNNKILINTHITSAVFILCQGSVSVTYVSSCSLRLFSWSVVLSFSCSTLSLSCSNMIFWLRLEQPAEDHVTTKLLITLTHSYSHLSGCELFFVLFSSSYHNVFTKCFLFIYNERWWE